MIFLTTAVLSAVAAGAPAAEETPPTSPERVEKLIQQLGDANYEAREQAQAALAKVGFDAFESLIVAQESKDLEVSARAKYLLRLMQADLTDKNDPPEVVACLENYRLLSPPEQIRRMYRLAALPDAKGVPALCRLVRFDYSAAGSKQAALAILQRPLPEDAARAKWAAMLRDNLRESRRPAALWLLTHAKLHDDPRHALVEWKALVEKEKAALARGDRDTDAAVVAALVSLQLRWTCRWEKNSDDVAVAMRTLLGMAAGNLPAPPLALVDWLIERKAWEITGMDPAAFAERFARDPKTLLYRLAKAYQTSGNRQLADEAAQKALTFDLNGAVNPLMLHFQSAYLLQRDGLFKWAEAEYREVTKADDLSAPMVLTAYLQLAEMLHDQSDDLRAAQVLADLGERLKKQTVVDEATTKEQQKFSGVRREFLAASHWAAAGDRAKQRQCLDKALAIDPTDVDVLIACYHFPDAAPEYREKIRGLIREMIARLQMEIRTSSDQSHGYNQLAWLIANTEGDVDEAIRASHKSIQLLPKRGGYYDNDSLGGYYDTLGRCYFAKGDYGKAVEYQTKAAELVPHGGQIARQLELFRKTYEEKTGKPAPKKTPAPAKPDPNAAPPTNPDAEVEEEVEMDVETPSDQ